MKTILLLVLALAIVAGASAQKPEAVAIKSSGMELKIDGVLDEAIWATAEKYQIDSVFNGEEIAGGAADCSGYFQVAWSNSGIYVAVTVTDDSTNVTGPQGQNWAWDMVEIYLDMNAGNLADTLGPQGGKGHYQIAGLAKDGAVKWGTNSKFAYKTDGSNYVKETFVRWSDLKDKKGNIVSASDSLELGFDIYIVDNDRDSVASARQFRDRLVWSNKGEIGEAYGNMNDAGILKFNVDSASAVVNPYVTVSSKVKGMPLTIDGVLNEAVWKNAEKYQIETPFKGEEIAGGAADCSGYFQTLWNYQGIYIAVTVTDDSTNVTGPQGQNWAWDMVEIYLDMNAGNLADSIGPAGGKGHYQIAGLAKDGAVKWGTNSSFAYKTTGSNYVKEAFIKWSDLKDANGNTITPADSVEIGFDMYIVDNDRDSVSSARQFRDRLVWANKGDINEAYSNMNDAGILKFDVNTVASENPAVATISKVTGDTIVANGILDESVWVDAAKINIEQVYKGEKIEKIKDCSGYFQSVWNENGIYIAVTVTDDSTNVTGPQGANWAWDMVEIYFDANVGNLKDGRGPQESLGHYQIAGLAIDGTSKWGKSSVVSYLTNKSSYIKETFVSWSDLKDSAGVALTPAKDLKIGFDVYIIDNDRDSLSSARQFRDRLVWANWGDITESYDNMNDAGVIVLSNTEIANDYDFVSVSENSLISEAMVYPNPAKDVLYIRNVSEKAVVSILSIDGRIMLQSKGSSMININTLQKGLYFVRVNDQNKITNKRIVIK
jgi:hypothetical protein